MKISSRYCVSRRENLPVTEISQMQNVPGNVVNYSQGTLLRLSDYMRFVLPASAGQAQVFANAGVTKLTFNAGRRQLRGSGAASLYQLYRS